MIARFLASLLFLISFCSPINTPVERVTFSTDLLAGDTLGYEALYYQRTGGSIANWVIVVDTVLHDDSNWVIRVAAHCNEDSNDTITDSCVVKSGQIIKNADAFQFSLFYVDQAVNAWSGASVTVGDTVLYCKTYSNMVPGGNGAGTSRTVATSSMILVSSYDSDGFDYSTQVTITKFRHRNL
jgi:hypothetical protein